MRILPKNAPDVQRNVIRAALVSLSITSAHLFHTYNVDHLISKVSRKIGALRHTFRQMGTKDSNPSLDLILANMPRLVTSCYTSMPIADHCPPFCAYSSPEKRHSRSTVNAAAVSRKVDMHLLRQKLSTLPLNECMQGTKVHISFRCMAYSALLDQAIPAATTITHQASHAGKTPSRTKHGSQTKSL